tara:strand:- start:351 stop:566 length:216 start_codon:yes stop_codon:yes gene_type:complete
MKLNHTALAAETAKICAEIKDRKNLERAGLYNPLAGFSDGFKLAALRSRHSDNPLVTAEAAEFEINYQEEF